MSSRWEGAATKMELNLSKPCREQLKKLLMELSVVVPKSEVKDDLNHLIDNLVLD